jgi:hypothetical protein
MLTITACVREVTPQHLKCGKTIYIQYSTFFGNCYKQLAYQFNYEFAYLFLADYIAYFTL